MKLSLLLLGALATAASATSTDSLGARDATLPGVELGARDLTVTRDVAPDLAERGSGGYDGSSDRSDDGNEGHDDDDGNDDDDGDDWNDDGNDGRRGRKGWGGRGRGKGRGRKGKGKGHGHGHDHGHGDGHGGCNGGGHGGGCGQCGGCNQCGGGGGGGGGCPCVPPDPNDPGPQQPPLPYDCTTRASFLVQTYTQLYNYAISRGLSTSDATDFALAVDSIPDNTPATDRNIGVAFGAPAAVRELLDEVHCNTGSTTQTKRGIAADAPELDTRESSWGHRDTSWGRRDGLDKRDLDSRASSWGYRSDSRNSNGSGNGNGNSSGNGNGNGNRNGSGDVNVNGSSSGNGGRGGNGGALATSAPLSPSRGGITNVVRLGKQLNSSLEASGLPTWARALIISTLLGAAIQVWASVLILAICLVRIRSRPSAVSVEPTHGWPAAPVPKAVEAGAHT